MTFTAQVTYLLQKYNFEISTTDEKHFTCTRKTEAEEWNAPPETMQIILGEVPDTAVWGKSLAALYLDLLEQITDHMKQGNGD